MYNAAMTTFSASSFAKIASICHALSDETRVRLVERLGKGEQCVCDLTESFKTGQSRLSFHLKVLKDAGLVIDRPEGRWVYYSLNVEAGEDLQDIVNWFKSPSQRSANKGRCP
jgi:ArsR family transcriptional regulator